MEFRPHLDLLKSAGPFALLGDAEREALAEAMTLHVFPLGECVFSKGDAGDAYHVVVSGRARVVGIDAAGNEVSLGVLSRGDCFGEGALLSNAPRGATVRAAEDLVLLSLDRTRFQEFVRSRPEARALLERYLADQGVQNFLKQFTALGTVPAPVLRELVRELEPLHVAAGAVVIREGEPGDTFYIVRKGSLEAVRRDGAEDRVVGYVATGEFFGERALLTGEPRAASVVARSEADLYVLSRAGFEKALQASPELRRRIERMAAAYRRAGIAPEAPPPAPVEAPAPEPEERLASTGPAWRRLFKAYPFVAQHDETDCGAACLAMLTKYYGVSVGVARLRDMANVDRDGATMWSVAQAAEALGFHARGLQLSYEALCEIAVPSIVHWEGFHYIVLYEAGRKRAIVGDPAIGIRRLTAEEFRRGWTGRALECTPTPNLQKTEKARTSFARFLPILKPHRVLVAEVLLASMLLNLFGLGVPLFTQTIVDRIVVHRSADLLNMLLVGMLFLACFQAATTAVRRLLLVHISTHADVRLLADFLRHVMSLPMRFFDLRRVGDVLSRVNENEKIRQAMVGTIPGFVLDSLLALGYFVLLAFYNVKLTLLVLLAMPFLVGLVIAFTGPIRRIRKEHFARSADQWSYLIESLTGIGTVKAMAIEAPVRWRWETLFVESVLVGRRGAHLQTTYTTLAGLFSSIAGTLFLWYGAHQVIDNQMSIGQLIAFTAIAAGVIQPVLRLVEAWEQLQEVRNAAERLNDIFDARPEEDHARTLLSLPRVDGRIRFENV